MDAGVVVEGQSLALSPGQPLVHRLFTHDRLVCVRTGRVVAHDERGLRLWFATGNPGLDWHSLDGRGIRDMPFAEWLAQPSTLVPTRWTGPDVLMLVPPDVGHSIWWFWHPNGEFARWYVNLEEPAVLWRTDDLAGVDVCDYDLDIQAYPDGSWEWKDEDEFTERLAFPNDYWVPDPEAVRMEGARVMELFAERRFPFDGTWCDWRPDPSWASTTTIPPGADRPRVRVSRASGDG